MARGHLNLWKRSLNLAKTLVDLKNEMKIQVLRTVE
jgi:hypothetical protein